MMRRDSREQQATETTFGLRQVNAVSPWNSRSRMLRDCASAPFGMTEAAGALERPPIFKPQILSPVVFKMEVIWSFYVLLPISQSQCKASSVLKVWTEYQHYQCLLGTWQEGKKLNKILWEHSAPRGVLGCVCECACVFVCVCTRACTWTLIFITLHFLR